MKKALIVAAAVLFLAAGLPLFAQTYSAASNPQQAYNKIVPLTKVWMHSMGYMLQFFNSHSQVSNIYVPFTWFNQGINSKADIVYGTDSTLPYASIFWVDGKFDHITIYAYADYNSPTWGVLEDVTDRTSQFNVQEVPKDF